MGTEFGCNMSGRYGGGGLTCETGCGKSVYMAEKITFKLDKVAKYWHPKCFVCQHESCGKRISNPLQAHAVPNPNSPTGAEYVVCANCKRNFYANRVAKVKWTKKTEGKDETKNKGSSRFGGGGVKCAACGKTAYKAEQVSFEKKIYHAKCIVCVTCKKNKSVADIAIHDGQMYCLIC